MWFLFVLLGAINLNFFLAKRNFGRYAVSTILRLVASLFFIGYIEFYLNLPALYWPNILWVLFFPALLNFVMSVIEEVGMSNSRSDDSAPATKIWGIFSALVVVVMFFIMLSPYFDPQTKLRGLPKIQYADQMPPETIEKMNTGHLVIMPPEHAIWKMQNALGTDGKNRGAFFKVDDVQQQRIKGRQSYAAPLTYQGFGSWSRSDGSEAFFIVDAEDIEAKPQPIECTKPMVYLPGAYWGENLDRHIYFSGYNDYTILDRVFEVDDNLQPWFIVSLSRFSTGFTGDVVLKILLIDPCTGEIQPYAPGTTPAWVDRANPIDLVKKYANYWGKYVHGWWNMTGLWGSKDKLKVAGNVIMIYGTGEHPDFLVQMTSHSETDQALVGYFLFNSHVNSATYFPVSGIGFGTSETVKMAVEARDEVRTPKYHANWCTLYRNIYGEMTWVVPVMAPTHQIEMISLVYAPNSTSKSSIAIGNTKDEALVNYLDVLSEMRSGQIDRVPTDSAYLMKASGIVERISIVPMGSSYKCYVSLQNHENTLYQIPASINPIVVAMTRDDDIVSLEYLDTGEGVLSVRSFENSRFSKLKVSGDQAAHNKEVTESRGDDKDREEYLKLLDSQKRLEELKKKFGGTVGSANK